MKKIIALIGMKAFASLFSLTAKIALFIFLVSSLPVSAQNADSNKWVGTWSCAPYAAGSHTPPSPYLANNTLRQIVRVSIGGDTLRLKFSNITCSTPLSLNSVNIAVSTDGGGSGIDSTTIAQLSFKGDASITLDPYSEIFSDPIAFPLTPGMRLAITIYYGQCETSSDMTFHYGSRTDSYILAGDQTLSPDFAGATRVERWYSISSVEVLAPSKCAAVAVLGNSITDGYGLHGGLKNKWTDTFSEKLNADTATSHVSVLNLGIGATLLTTSGVSRFRHDILNQSGLRWIIIFYGVNDIGANLPAENIIKAYERLIEQAHTYNIRIYGATITPFKGHGYYSTEREATRVAVNEWIRTPGNFDKCIDFDKTVRDPSDTAQLLQAYSNDWLHPSADGYKVLGESIDLSLFLGQDTLIGGQFDTTKIEEHYFEAECSPVGTNWNIVEDAGASNRGYVSVKDGVESLNAPAAGSDNVIDFSFTLDRDTSYTIYARLNCPSPNDDSFWVKMDDGDYVMCNGLGTSGWQWVPMQTYDLSSGDHLLSITYREDGAKLDKVCISNYIFEPYGMGEEALNKCEPEYTPIEQDTTESDAIEAMNHRRSGFNLNNYPNPFKEKTRVEFELQNPSCVSVKVLSLTGKDIAELTEKEYVAGKHEVEFDSGDIPPGIYIASISDGKNNLAFHKILKY